jgi:hypothetical protein
MGKIKDGIGQKQTVTLQQSEIDFLRRINAKFQQHLDVIMQEAAADFLRYIAVNRFEYSPDQELLFDFKPDKEEDNLEITVVTK